MIAEQFLLREIGMHAILLLPSDDGKLSAANSGPGRRDYLEHRALRQHAFERGEPVGVNALADTDQAVAYIPLKAPMRIRGTLAVAPADASQDRPEAGRIAAAGRSHRSSPSRSSGFTTSMSPTVASSTPASERPAQLGSTALRTMCARPRPLWWGSPTR
jgi:hypothetical protein